MQSIPKKVRERFSKTVRKFQSILEIAKVKDINESDTVAIISDILAEVFGYDKYLEITSEFAIRSTYCDLAVKLDDKVQFLIEVKAVGVGLKESHMRQTVDYGANHGIPWILLTNGIEWNLYRIRFEKPISYDDVCSFDFLKLNARVEKDQEVLFIISKEGVRKNARAEFYEKVQSVNRFVVAAIVLSDASVAKLRSELRRVSPGVKITNAEVETLLRNEVLKREVVDGDEAKKAQAQVKRASKKRSATRKKEDRPDGSSESPSLNKEVSASPREPSGDL